MDENVSNFSAAAYFRHHLRSLRACFLVSTWAEALACQERAMAPLLAMSSKQTFWATLGVAFVGGHDICCATVSSYVFPYWAALVQNGSAETAR